MFDGFRLGASLYSVSWLYWIPPRGPWSAQGLGSKERDRIVGWYPPEIGFGADEPRRRRDALWVRVWLLETRIGIWKHEQTAGPQAERGATRHFFLRTAERRRRFIAADESRRGRFAAGFTFASHRRGFGCSRAKSGARQPLALGGREIANCRRH